jgi:hypothetical protein
LSLIRALFVFILLISMGALADDAPLVPTVPPKYRLGVGHSQQTFIYRRFKKDPGGQDSQFHYRCIEADGAVRSSPGGVLGVPSFVSAELQLHHCLESQNSNQGSLRLDDAVLNGVWNLRVLESLGLEMGFGGTVVFQPENISSVGMGYVIGATYTFGERFELRFRKENKLLLHIGSKCEIRGYTGSIAMYF